MRRKELQALLDKYIAEHFTGDEVFEESFSPAEKIFDEEIPKPKTSSQARYRRRRESHYESPPRMGFMVPQFSRVSAVAGTLDFNKIFEETAGETFSEMLVRLVKESGKKPSLIYNAATVQRQIYQRIKDNKNYKPSKDTVIAFAVALKLDLPTTKKLLETAGFALSNASKRDVIISFFIESEIFSVIKLNETLYDYKQDILFKRE